MSPGDLYYSWKNIDVSIFYSSNRRECRLLNYMWVATQNLTTHIIQLPTVISISAPNVICKWMRFLQPCYISPEFPLFHCDFRPIVIVLYPLLGYEYIWKSGYIDGPFSIYALYTHHAFILFYKIAFWLRCKFPIMIIVPFHCYVFSRVPKKHGFS